MSRHHQGQSKRHGGSDQEQQSIKYGDLFNVSGELAEKPVAPQDAALMQSAEKRTFGQVPSGGPGETMQQAAEVNERIGKVGHEDATDLVRHQGVTISETDVPGARLFAETVAGQVVGQFMQPTTTNPTPTNPSHHNHNIQSDEITIGEALEATATTHSAATKPITRSDAAAIEAAEKQATGRNSLTPGRLASIAYSAVNLNAQVNRKEDMITLGNVLEHASGTLPTDKKATREDAERVVAAEMHANPNVATRRGGVGTAVAAAARLNEQGASPPSED